MRGRETEEGREDGSERLGSGTRVASPEKARASRKHAGREEVARTAASRCPRPSGEEEDDRGVAVAGWAVLLGQVGYQVSAR